MTHTAADLLKLAEEIEGAIKFAYPFNKTVKVSQELLERTAKTLRHSTAGGESRELAERFRLFGENAYRPEVFGKEDRVSGPMVSQDDCFTIANALAPPPAAETAVHPGACPDFLEGQLAAETPAREAATNWIWKDGEPDTSASVVGDREAIAKIVYDAFPFSATLSTPHKPEWTPGGNSLMQGEARRAADKILPLTSQGKARSERSAVQSAQPVAWRVKFDAKDTWTLYYSDPLSLDEDRPEIIEPLYNVPAQASRDTPDGFNFYRHLYRQREWSGKTFGPGPRTKGVVDHIRKELCEIEADPTDITEWIDVVILALDGAWRAGAWPDQIIATIVAKQTKNEGRVWPDWRTSDPDKAIEHVRGSELPSASRGTEA